MMDHFRLKDNHLIDWSNVRRYANEDRHLFPNFFYLLQGNWLFVWRRRYVMCINSPNSRLNARDLLMILTLNVRYFNLLLNVTRASRSIRFPANYS